MLERDRLDALLQELKAQLVRLYGDRSVNSFLCDQVNLGSIFLGSFEPFLTHFDWDTEGRAKEFD